MNLLFFCLYVYGMDGLTVFFLNEILGSWWINHFYFLSVRVEEHINVCTCRSSSNQTVLFHIRNAKIVIWIRFCQIDAFSCLQVDLVYLVTGIFEGLRYGIASFSFFDDIVFESVVVSHKFLWNSVSLHPFIVYSFHYHEIEVVSMSYSRATQVDHIVETW
jgi:hypothetical protein